MTIQGSAGSVFVVSSSATATIDAVTISGGVGSGIDNGGTLVVTRSTITGNSAGEGGGIYNGGFLTVENSTISGNAATTSGGGIHNAFNGLVNVTFSTITDNTAPVGAGVWSQPVASLITSTFVGASILAGNNGPGGDVDSFDLFDLEAQNSFASGGDNSSVAATRSTRSTSPAI